MSAATDLIDAIQAEHEARLARDAAIRAAEAAFEEASAKRNLATSALLAHAKSSSFIRIAVRHKGKTYLLEMLPGKTAATVSECDFEEAKEAQP